MLSEIKNIVNYILELLGLEWIEKEMLFFISVSIIVVGLSRLLIKYISLKRIANNLNPYYSYQEVFDASSDYIKTRGQNVSPMEAEDPSLNYTIATSKNIIRLFSKKLMRNKNPYKYYIILGGAGMGKTTFLINLYKRLKRKYTFSLLKELDVYLFPISSDNAFKDIEEISNQKKANSILLLDAFDESKLAEDDYRKELDRIIEKTWRFNKVVITCRTHFFASEFEEPSSTSVLRYGTSKGSHDFIKFYLSPFSDSEIRKYLFRKYIFSINPISGFRKYYKAFSVVDKAPSLVARPMLLSRIDDIIELKVGYLNFVYKIYEKLIDGWIEREAMRKHSDRFEFKKNLYLFSSKVAERIYFNHRERNNLTISPTEILELASNYSIELSDIDMRSRSLLNRKSDGSYKFAHKTIYEYFMAVNMSNSFKIFNSFDFSGNELAHQFFYEMSSISNLYENFGNRTPSDFDAKSCLVIGDKNKYGERYAVIELRANVVRYIGRILYIYLAPPDRKNGYVGSCLFLIAHSYSDASHAIYNDRLVHTDADWYNYIEVALPKFKNIYLDKISRKSPDMKVKDIVELGTSIIENFVIR